MTLAHNTSSEDEVDLFIECANRAGAEIIKAPQKVFWGDYSGYFRDLDNHIWEVAFNPMFTPE